MTSSSPLVATADPSATLHRYVLISLLALAAWSPPSSHAQRSGRPFKPVARLVAAVKRADAVEIERAANRLGLGGLRRILASPKSPEDEVKAALRGALYADKAWYLLPAVAARGRDGDVALAREALAVTRRIAGDLGRRTLRRHEESTATLRPLASVLLAIASDRRRPPTVRGDALLALAEAREVLGVKDAALLRFLSSSAPEVRRAAVQLFAGAVSVTSLPPLAKLVAADTDAAVARGAAAVVCAALPAKRAHRSLFVATLRHAGAADRLAALIADGAIDEQIEIARCLRALRTRAARRALSRALRRPAVRRALRRLPR